MPPAPSPLPRIRLFLSSPGDVAEERNICLSVIRDLQGEFQGSLVLLPILWEQMPLLATAGFQEEIDRRAPPSQADIAIFVLWSRLGTPLSEAFELEDGRRPTGTEWEFEDAIRHTRAQGVPHILVYRKVADPITKASLPREVLLRQSSDWAAVEEFFARHFQRAGDHSFKGSYHAFGAPSQFGERLRTHLRALLRERLGAPPAEVAWAGSPFRGLEPFEAEHARVFFGRRRAIEEVRQTLARQIRRGQAFVLIVGASGHGKSSLARAGLLPRLAGPWVADPSLTTGFCRRAIVRPGDGTTPLEALVQGMADEGALSDLVTEGASGAVARAWRQSPQAAVNDSRGALAREAARTGQPPDSGRLVLLIDQLEEMFTREGVDEAERQAFANVLEALARSGSVWILATLRSDFYPMLLDVPALRAMKEGDGQYELDAPDDEELADIVRLPATAAGLTFEADPTTGRALDAVLIAEARRGRDALPLLQYALTCLESARVGGTLTLAAYDALGGLEGAIGQRAEATWAELDEAARDAFPSLLRALVDVAEGGAVRATARRTPMGRLARTPGARAFLGAFLGARLLTASGRVDGGVVTVAHEALLRRWGRAADQIAAEAEFLRIQTRLRAEAGRWEEGGRPGRWEFWRGRDLEGALLLPASGFELDERERSYLDAASRQARRARRARRAATGAIAALALVATGAAVLARRNQREAEAHARQAERERDGRARALQEAIAQRQSARSAALAVAANETAWTGSLRSVLLAREAVRAAPTPQALTALQAALLAQQEQATLDAHDGGILCLALSPAGDRLLTTSDDHTVRLWDLTGRPLAVLHGHGGEVGSAAFSPDGGRIVSASIDGTARIWDVEGRSMAVLQGHTQAVQTAVFSPDGTRILTASYDNTARLWDLEGRSIAVLRGHEGEVWTAVFSPDGTRILTASVDETARIWDVEGRSMAVLQGHTQGVQTAVFSPDGTRILTASYDNTARLWDLEGRSIAVLAGHTDWVWTAAFSPDGTRVLTASADHTARLWDLEGGPIAVLRGHTEGVNAAVFSADGAHILTMSADQTARLWAATGSPVGVLRGHTRTVNGAVFSPRGDRIFTAAADGTVRRWELGLVPGEAAPQGGLSDADNLVAFTNDGSEIVTVSKDGTMRRQRLGEGGVAVLRVYGMGALYGFQVSRDNRRLLARTGGFDASLWDTAGGFVARLRGHSDVVTTCVFSPDGLHILTASQDATARLWDLTGAPGAVLRGHSGVVRTAAYSPDGSRVVTASDDHTVRLWDREGGLIAILRGHTEAAFDACFSPDGTRILSASGDHTARLWSMQGDPLAVLRGHEGAVVRATFSPDGTLILTASSDQTARIWNADGEETAVLRGHEGSVRSATFSPRGDRILTTTENGPARLWDLSGNPFAVLGRGGSPVYRAEFSPDGRHILVVAAATGYVTAYLTCSDPADLLEVADERITRDLSREERNLYGDLLEPPR